MKEWKLSLEKVQGCRAPHEAHPRYRVMLNGRRSGLLYFNMTGYTGCYLPQPSGIPLDIGEGSISEYRRAVAVINKEARADQ
jgi:hypothetical protein